MSSTAPWVVSALVSGGFGAGLASLITAVIQTQGKKSESRATAADLIAQAAGSLAARQGELIAKLEARVERQAAAIVALTAAIDELLPQVPLVDEEREKLHQAILAAKLAV